MKIYIGLCLIGFVQNVGVRYFGVFLAAIPSTANGPCILTWQANNVRGISLSLSSLSPLLRIFYKLTTN